MEAKSKDTEERKDIAEKKADVRDIREEDSPEKTPGRNRALRIGAGIALLAVVTAGVIALGTGIPRVMLGSLEKENVRKKGSVNIDDVHPYGAEIMEFEQTVEGFYKVYDEIDPYTPEGETGTVYKSTGYKIGTEPAPIVSGDDDDTPVYEIFRAIEDSFGFKMPEKIVTSQIPADGSLTLFGQGERSLIVESSFEIPLSFVYTFRRADDPYIPSFWARVVSIYSNHTGIDFISTPDENSYYGSSDITFSYYSYQADSPDGKLVLSMDVVKSDAAYSSVNEDGSMPSAILNEDGERLYDWVIMISLSPAGYLM